MPTNLTGHAINNTYDQLLHVDGGPTATEQVVYSGSGVASALKLGTVSLSVGNIRLKNNTISTLDTNGNLVLAPDGTGAVTIANANITGGAVTGITALAVADGGTGASDAAGARSGLGLGSIATQHANNVAITGGTVTGITDLTVADGGTGASTAAGARTNLGLGTIATQASGSVSITGGTITGTPISGSTVGGTVATLSDGLVLPKTSGKGIKVDTTTPTFGWRDLIGAVTPKATGAGYPTRAVYRGGTIGEYSFIANDVADLTFHIPHDYVPGTDIYIHVHWSHNGTAIIGNAVFDIYHTYAKGFNQAAFPAEKMVTATYATVDITTTPRYQHRTDEVQLSTSGGSATLMDTDALEVDGVILATIKLNTLPTITAGNLFIHSVDIHYQSTGVMGTKAKAPNFYT